MLFRSADFLATGEVLGERPKSQNRRALELVASTSGAGDLLLRPLSARLLPATRPEKEGWVDRDDLLDLRGRSRKRQMDLAERWGISEYQTPAGGCLLTDPGFSARLRGLMEKVPSFNGADAELLKLGRHFWVGNTLIVLGRRQEENERLAAMARPDDLLLTARDEPGPTALIRPFQPGEERLEKAWEEAARLLGIYGKKKEALSPDRVIELEMEKPGKEDSGRESGRGT